MKLFVHPTTRTVKDYGEHLVTERGIMWSTDGENLFGWEEGVTVETARARIADLTPEQQAVVEIVEGEPVHRTFDINPRGLI